MPSRGGLLDPSSGGRATRPPRAEPRRADPRHFAGTGSSPAGHRPPLARGPRNLRGLQLRTSQG
eukprot:549520-Alexandrium_andersonii.AAC.1